MGTFFPSEIARLVLGYLKEDNCLKSWETFLEESSNLREYFTLFKGGKVYSTNVNGYSLLDILNEYCILKFHSINKDSKAENLSLKSEIIGTLREESLVESAKKTIDSISSKYISPSHNLRDNLSTDLSPCVCELPFRNDCGSKEIGGHSRATAKNLSFVEPRCDEKNATSAEYEVDNRNKSHEQDKAQGDGRNKKLKSKLDAGEKRNNQSKFSPKKRKRILSQFLNVEYPPHQSLSSFIQSLSDKLNKGSPSVNSPNFSQHGYVLRDKSQPSSKLKPSYDENTVSSTETVLLDDDDDIKVIEEIKKENKSSFNLNVKYSAIHNDNTSANQKVIKNTEKGSTPINQPGYEIKLSNNSNVDVQTNSFKDVRSEQTDSNDGNKINVLQSKTDSSSNQVPFVNSGSFMHSSVSVNETSFSYPQNYVLPNYATSNTYTNNGPIYYVLNSTSSGTVINGTILTVPKVQNNVATCPVLPSTSTAFVNNAITSPLNLFSNPLPATNVVTSVDKISVPSVTDPPKETLTASSVGLSNTLRNIPTTTVDDNVFKSSLKTYSKGSQTSKVSKRKKSSHKRSHKKKSKDSSLTKDKLISSPKAYILSLTGYKADEHSNKGKFKTSSDKQNQKASKKERSNNKASDAYPPILKVKIANPKKKVPRCESISGEEHFPQLGEVGSSLNSSYIIEKPNRELKHCSKSVSSCSTTQSSINKSALSKSNFPGVKDNRVLKVMLSDIFVDIPRKIESLDDQKSDSDVELSVQIKSENQICDPKKMTLQNQNSPQTTINNKKYHMLDEILNCSLE